MVELAGTLPGVEVPGAAAPRRARRRPANLGAIIQDRLRVRFLERTFRDLGRRRRLLDLGCAGKPFAGLYGPLARRSFGIDVPRSRHDLRGIDAAADGRALPFRDGAFDAVLCTEVMEHVPEPLKLLREIRRVLMPGGRAVLTTPFLVAEHEAPFDYFRYTRYGLEHLAAEAGLEVLTLEPFGGLVGSLLAFASHVQLKAWEKLRLARLANPLVFLGVYLPQVSYLAALGVARRLPALRRPMEKLSYAPRGYGLVLARP